LTALLIRLTHLWSTPVLLQAQEGGQAGFKYGYIMMDKSRQEMAAVRQLVLTGDAIGFLLCYFHVVQDWERFVRSSESGVADKGMQHRVLVDLAKLAHTRDKRLFEDKVGAAAHIAAPRSCKCGGHMRQHLVWSTYARNTATTAGTDCATL
jgi:hypothetical protein